MITENNALSEEDIISQTCNHFPVPFEIDTVRLFLGRDEVNENVRDFLFRITCAEKSKYNYKGWYKGFSFKFKEAGITITGSFSNYYVGPFSTLSFTSFKAAVEKLEKELKLSLRNARVYRVDCNWNVLTDLEAKAYGKFLFLDIPRFKRFEKDQSVNFETKNKTLIIYNKSSELEAKLKVSSDFTKNWLRVEYRILRGVRKETGIMYLKDLFLKENFMLLLQELKSYFFKVVRRTEPINRTSDLKKRQDYLKMLIRKGCEARGGIENILDDIEQMDKMSLFSHRKQKYELRNSIKAILQNENLSTKHRLIEELDTKFITDFNNAVNFLSLEN